MESNTKEESIKSNKLVEGLKVFVTNIMIFTIIDLIMFRMIHVKHSFITFVIYTIIVYFVTSAYRETILESKKMGNISFYFWGIILPFLMGYGIYGLVWNDETMSQYTNMRGVIDAVFLQDGSVKGVFMAFLLNSASVSFERILVFVGLILIDIGRRKDNTGDSNDAKGTDTNTDYEDTVSQESLGEENDKSTEKSKEERENAIEFFKGVKNLDDLKKRYHDLLKIYHPDNNAGDTEVTVIIKAEFEQLEKQFSSR